VPTLRTDCSKECQVADWAVHKPMCKQLGKVREQAEQAIAAGGELSWKKQQVANSTTLAALYATHPNLETRMQAAAWEHRHVKGFVLVQSKSMSMEPSVTAVLWSEWRGSDGIPYDERNIQCLTVLLEDSARGVDEKFVATFDIRGTADNDKFAVMGSWGYTKGFLKDFTPVIYLYQLVHAFDDNTPAEHRESVIARTKALLQRCPELTLPFYAQLEMDATGTEFPRVRLKGLSNSSLLSQDLTPNSLSLEDLNGQEGVHFVAYYDARPTPKHCIRLADGKEITVKEEKIEFVRRLV
jgi:hypothetical protein